MRTFFEKHIKRILPCILIMLISCCIFTVNAGAETVVFEENQLFGSPDVLTASMARSVDSYALKEYLRTELVKCPATVDVSSFNLEYTENSKTILKNIIYYESPELFHISGYSMSVSNDKIKTITPKYSYTAQEYTTIYNECMTQADIILDGIRGNSKLNDVQKALLIHDRLAVHCEYDVSVYTTGNVPDESFTMYGTLAKGVSVCQGYAETYYYLLEKVGIENRLCSSDALYHVWNIVTINGKEYHVDVTWDDPNFDKTGQVYHTNFLRSSDGIYETDHDASDYDTSPTDTTYDNYFWQCSNTEFQMIGNEIYYIDNDAEAIKKYSNKSSIADCSDVWPASTNGSFWIGNFARLSSDGTNLYYNTATDVYKYTVSSGGTEKIWSPDLSANVLFRIYGFTYKNGYLICDINSTPNFNIGDKATYQQRYLYHDQASSTLQSVSISTMPNKTEYYIGDSLNTQGLQIKLTHSNGMTEIISNGFTVSGFSSSSGGSKKVTVTYDGFSTTFNVNVRTPSISLDASSVNIDLKDYCILSATTDPANVAVTWSTSDSSVARVYNGEIESVSTGTATITASFTYNGYTYKATCNVTVECNHASLVTVKGKNATCTENGLTDGKKCSVCNTVTVAQKIIDKTGHREVTVKGKDATCTENGLTDGKKCSVCNTVTVAQKTINKTGHKEVTVKGKSSTCTETGLTDGKKCSVCNTVTVAQKIIDKTGHREVTVKGKDATCTENGLTDGKKCSLCGVTIIAQSEIAKKNHRTVKIPGKEPTETENGLTQGEKCFVCGTITKEQQIIPALNHTHEYALSVTEPTCTEQGYTTYTCNCGDTYKADFSYASGHDAVVIPGKAATCTETGITEGEKCTVCGEILVVQEVIEKTGHSEIEIEAKAPTCTEKGCEAGKICSVCNEIVVAVKEIEMLGHDPGEWETVTAAEIGKDGLMQQKCTRCGDVLDEKIIPAFAEKPKNALGDANNDGKVTAADARLVLRMSAKIDSYSDAQISYLDLNKDGKITAADARLLLRISAKIESIEKYM